MLRAGSRLGGLNATLDDLADGIALPDDADVAGLVDAAGVDADELVHRPGRDAATGVAIRSEFAGGEDDGRTRLAGPGAAVDQEGRQVPPGQAGRPRDGSPRPHAEWDVFADWVEADGEADHLEFGAKLHPGSRGNARVRDEVQPLAFQGAPQRQRDNVHPGPVNRVLQPVRSAVFVTEPQHDGQPGAERARLVHGHPQRGCDRGVAGHGQAVETVLPGHHVPVGDEIRIPVRVA